jgi:WbqC-like protein family
VTLGIMQPYLFPYIGYFQLLAAVDRFVVYDDVTFIKQGWINRNRMLINGEAAFFTVPIAHKSSAVAIRDTEISSAPEHRRWAEKTLKSFENAYRRAPEFAGTYPMLERVFTSATSKISELAADSIRAVAELLEIRTPIVATSSIYGRELYAHGRFSAEGIELRFLTPQPIEYAQFGDTFVPWLSIVDVLMFNPLARVREYLHACEVA